MAHHRSADKPEVDPVARVALGDDGTLTVTQQATLALVAPLDAVVRELLRRRGEWRAYDELADAIGLPDVDVASLARGLQSVVPTVFDCTDEGVRARSDAETARAAGETLAAGPYRLHPAMGVVSGPDGLVRPSEEQFQVWCLLARAGTAGIKHQDIVAEWRGSGRARRTAKDRVRYVLVKLSQRRGGPVSQRGRWYASASLAPVPANASGRPGQRVEPDLRQLAATQRAGTPVPTLDELAVRHTVSTRAVATVRDRLVDEGVLVKRKGLHVTAWRAANADELTGVLRSQILERELAPGERLPDPHDLVAAYGVTADDVREAFRRLAQLDWISGCEAPTVACEDQLQRLIDTAMYPGLLIREAIVSVATRSRKGWEHVLLTPRELAILRELMRSEGRDVLRSHLVMVLGHSRVGGAFEDLRAKLPAGLIQRSAHHGCYRLNAEHPAVSTAAPSGSQEER
jgi:DNA-binding transcriptional regulator YhcF (GntR family)